MKKIYQLLILSFTCSVLSTSCTDLLMEEHKNKITTDFLYSEPETLDMALVALYNAERSRVSKNDDSYEPFVWVFDVGTDIDVFRAGAGAKFSRFDTNFDPDNGDFNETWTKLYSIIGQTNDILAAVRDNNMDMEDPLVQRIVGEASMFRAHAYYWLFMRFGRLYLITEPVTYKNVEKIVCTPATSESVLKQINDDLDKAIELLTWEVPTKNNGAGILYGRFTKAVAKHLKIKVAMWEKKYDIAVEEAEDIFASGKYKLMSEPGKVFNAANLNHDEALYVFQFTDGKGGGGTASGGKFTGHRLSVHTTSQYGASTGLGAWSYTNGGFGWGRISPNHYLFSLYDQEKDKRFQQYFRLYFTYDVGMTIPPNKQIGDTLLANTETKYYDILHPQCEKYADRYTTLIPEQTNGFKDCIVYRLAETYLLAAEAYMRLGDQANAKKYYNMTWMRAGNDEETNDITLQMIMDEHARELCFEGHRFPFLKRLGVDILVHQVKTYGGEYTDKSDAAGKGLGARTPSPVKGFRDTWTAPKTAADRRYYFKPEYADWPIPTRQIDQMGVENFPQNPGYRY